MLFESTGQAWVFLLAVYGGILLGIVYDVCRMVRIALRLGRGATMLVDAAFWICAGIVMFAVLWYAGVGSFRAYMLLGFACGFTLYELALSRLVMTIYRWSKRLWDRFCNTRYMRRFFR